MTKTTNALILALGESIEEDVTLLIGDCKIDCFISYCPEKIDIGRSYAVEITMIISEPYEIEQIESPRYSAEKIGEGYSYFLYGYLKDDTFKTFTTLNDEDIHYDHPELNEKFVKLRVDRIDVSFG
jgi:hypothetical protein